MIKKIFKKVTDELRLKGYEILYPFYKTQFNVPKAHWQYSLNAQQIYGEDRQPGVSGYYRLYNEEDFLKHSVESHLPFFDEIILVHDSTTTDNTPAIAQALAEQYPDKVKYFFYEPAVIGKTRTKAFKILPANHPSSFANYSSFALSKTTKQIVTKIDGDHIAIPEVFEKITTHSHDMNFMANTFYTFLGINLWLYQGELLIDPGLVGMGDFGFHVMRPEKHYYIKDYQEEGAYFPRKNRQVKIAGILYFHLKNMRSGIPYHSYRGRDDKTHQARFKRRAIKTKQHLLDWQTFVKQYRHSLLEKTTADIAELPDPNDLLKDILPNIASIDSKQILCK